MVTFHCLEKHGRLIFFSSSDVPLRLPLPVPVNDLNVVSDELPSWAVAGVYHQHNIDHAPMLKDGVIARGLATEQLTRAVEAHERVGHGLEVTG